MTLEKQEFLVSVDVISRSLSLSELCSRLGVVQTPESRDKDKSETDGASFWRTFVPYADKLTFEEQWAHLREQLEITDFHARLIANDLRGNLAVAVFSQTATSTLSIDARLTNDIATFGLGLEITFYPCAS